MRVIDLINSNEKTAFSFEILPPLKGTGIEKLYQTIDTLREFDPKYINITTHRSEYVYKDLGNGLFQRNRLRRRPGTVAVAAAIQNKYNITMVPHILCSGFTREETEELIRKALTFSAEPPERRQARTKKYLPVYVICCVLGVAEALAVWAAGLADIEGALALLIIGVVFGVVYGAYAMFWMAETLPRYYDENRICNFAQGAFHIHIPGIYYNNRNWKHVLRAFRVWSMVSLVLVPPCTAGAVFVERATGWQVWIAVLVAYIASLFGAIVIPAKRFE